MDVNIWSRYHPSMVLWSLSNGMMKKYRTIGIHIYIFTLPCTSFNYMLRCKTTSDSSSWCLVYHKGTYILVSLSPRLDPLQGQIIFSAVSWPECVDDLHLYVLLRSDGDVNSLNHLFFWTLQRPYLNFLCLCPCVHVFTNVNLRGLSPRANYTHRVTTVCRRS
jgi:hypothetical protein